MRESSSLSLTKFCRIFLIAMPLFALLSGCVSQPRNTYNWGVYEKQVYAHFKSTGSPEQQLAALEQSSLKTAGKLVAPPGYHAHLGLLYGEVGRIDDMQVEFETEKLLFPESAPFMDFMLNKLNQSKKKGAL